MDFQAISFRHIYIIFNEEVDSLSKESYKELVGCFGLSSLVFGIC